MKATQYAVSADPEVIATRLGSPSADALIERLRHLGRADLARRLTTPPAARIQTAHIRWVEA